jgi:hypothetical protein
MFSFYKILICLASETFLLFLYYCTIERNVYKTAKSSFKVFTLFFCFFSLLFSVCMKGGGRENNTLWGTVDYSERKEFSCQMKQFNRDKIIENRENHSAWILVFESWWNVKILKLSAHHITIKSLIFSLYVWVVSESK